MTNRKWNAGGKVMFSSLYQTYSKLLAFAIPLPTSLALGHLIVVV